MTTKSALRATRDAHREAVAFAVKLGAPETFTLYWTTKGTRLLVKGHAPLELERLRRANFERRGYIRSVSEKGHGITYEFDEEIRSEAMRQQAAAAS